LWDQAFWPAAGLLPGAIGPPINANSRSVLDLRSSVFISG
jgi:hypothetical protein